MSTQRKLSEYEKYLIRYNELKQRRKKGEILSDEYKNLIVDLFDACLFCLEEKTKEDADTH